MNSPIGAGGTSSISFGGAIDASTAPIIDRSDTAALAFLAEATAKQQTQGKLGVSPPPRPFSLPATDTLRQIIDPAETCPLT